MDYTIEMLADEIEDLIESAKILGKNREIALVITKLEEAHWAIRSYFVNEVKI